MLRKSTVLLGVLTAWSTVASAHSGPDTPGIELHHLPTWGWVVLTAILGSVLYIMYAKAHDKPLNPLQWRSH